MLALACLETPDSLQVKQLWRFSARTSDRAFHFEAPRVQWRRTDRRSFGRSSASKTTSSTEKWVVKDIGYIFKIGRAGLHPLDVFSFAES